MFLEALKKKPMTRVELADDAETVPIFRELGLFERVQEHRRLSLVGTMIFAKSRHPTHWILCAHFSGCKKKEDDGFVVWCMPKAGVSEEEATRELQIFAERVGVPNWRDMRFKAVEEKN